MSRRSLNLYQNNHPYLHRLERILHRRMQMLVANSKAVLNELRQEADTVPVALIYNGVDLSNIAPPPQRRRNPDRLTLIIVANLIPYKAHADLFHALALAAEKLPASWELLCVGRDDGHGPILADLARRLHLERHIRMLGSRADIPTLLASADIGVLCSHEEGFSNAILEGMAAGLPMVVTDVGGNAEAIIDRESGLIVPARDPAALGAAILALASDVKLRETMGRAARSRVEMHFSLDQCVQRYDAIYRKLTGSFDAQRYRAE
jgi:glycosyltransferase involved in cell wall biosynthesis